MEGASTNSLRALAPKWSLAGDDQLLNLLQNTHQRIISKCQDVNSKLEEMASALDDASINLQNVNNKFMALSNSQFIESRVYDDDEDFNTDALPAKEPPQPTTIDELSMLKSSLLILERAHETAEILDDSDSDSDTEISVILKPRDMYSHRPLPHIIGSLQWKNKWHAGLIAEDSGSDSSTSQHEHRDVDQYSDTGSEAEETPRPQLEDHTISETSSCFVSEPATEATPPAPPTPSDIAAELARRLGGGTQVVKRETVEEYIPPTTTKVYKPEKPATSTIFLDEPPPLDNYEAEETQSEDEDIFAEINRNKPYTQRNTVQNNLAEDLFSFDKPVVEQGDIFSDFPAGNVEPKPSAKQKSTLFEDESEPELFAEKSPQKEVSRNNEIKEKLEIGTRKPVGGISLFGSNKGAESIGAAILKRNQRKSSTSGDESGCDTIQNRAVEDKPKNVHKTVEKPEPVAKRKTVDETDDKAPPKNERDIFDDLFAKSQKATEKKPAQNITKEPVKDKAKTHVKDLFSDNIFDDIDDIFTSNVKIPTKETNQKSIFDDDDLFSDIAKPVSKNQPSSSKNDQKYNSKDKKSIFDSDDDLFSEIKTDNSAATKVESQTKKGNETDIKASNANYNQEATTKIENTVKPTETTKERNLFDDSPQNVYKSDPKPQVISKSIFDSDSDEDIFAKIKSPANKQSNITENVFNSNINYTKPVDREENIMKPDSTQKLLTTENSKAEENISVIQSPSIFEEEAIDDLFINANKLKTDQNTPKETKVAQIKNIDLEPNNTIFETRINKTNTLSSDDKNESEYNKLPKSFNEIEQNVQEKSVPLPSQELTGKENIIDDKLLQDDLFLISKEASRSMPRKIVSEEIVTAEVIESSQKESKSTTEESNEVSNKQTVKTEPQLEDTKTTKPNKTEKVIETHKPQLENANQSLFDDIIEPLNEKKTVNSEHKKTILNEPDIFDDIFGEPPAFEKVAEPKKSKNVNALFDDDSDDESLFFKKDDIISDDKPELFSKNANFDLFVDEPPAIDIDFTTKPAKNMDDDDNGLFSSVVQVEQIVPETKKNDISNDDEDLFSPVLKLQERVPDSFIPETRIEDSTIDASKIFHEELETDVESSLFAKDNEKALCSTLEVEKHANTNINKAEEKVNNTLGKVSDSDNDLFSSLLKPNLPKSSQKDESSEQNEINVAKITTGDDFDDLFKAKESPSKDTEAKKIGKLNTKNFNINVNALIPGASPKKVPKERKDDQNIPNLEPENAPNMVKFFPTGDETDNYQPKSSSNKVENEDKDITEKNEPEIANSIKFEEKSDSRVLDTKISKQRPRIQVKRRPSSRRARHEAVRKSAIDFGDETDNSSSFDEPVKSKNLSKEDSKNVKHEDTAIHYTKDITNETQHERTSSDETTVKTNVFENVDTNIFPDNYEKDDKGYQNEPSVSNEIKTETQDINEVKQQRTTKVVYILNDEDIFNTNPKNVEIETDNIFATRDVENNTDNDIFKRIEGVSTLGKTYKEDTKKVAEVNKKDTITTNIVTKTVKNDENIIKKDVTSSKIDKTSLFDDSDEELFNNTKKVVKKITIFDSDSEEDLFSGKKRTEKHNKEQKNREVKERIDVSVKGSLFGDEDDDDDLFGVKKEKIEPKQQSSIPSTSKEATPIASKSVEPVFDDPLSMLGNDD